MKKVSISALFIFSIASISFAQTSIIDYYNAKVKEIQASISDASRKPIIKVNDEKNGFISYYLSSVDFMGFEEMAYFTSTNGKKFVATITFGCGPICSCGFPMFFELENGKLVNQTEKYLPESIQNSINQHYQEAKAEINTKLNYEGIPLSFWVKLPRIGTTIQIGLMEGGMEDGTFHLIDELQYDVENGDFKLVSK